MSEHKPFKTINIKDKNTKVCYVVMSFPQPSETFIAEEALSLYDYQLEPHILSLYEGVTSIVHESARCLIKDGNIIYIKPETRKVIFQSLLHLFLTQPLKTLKGLKKAVSSTKDRWLYMQMVPYANYLTKNSIHYIHAHFADRNIVYAKTLSDWTGIPFGVTTHRYDLLDDPIQSNVVSFILQKAACIITISHYNKVLMNEKYGIPLENIHVVHCGIRLDYFRPSAYPNNNNQILNLLTIGRLVPVKGQKYLIQALAELRDRGINFNLRIIGEGPLRQELKALITELGLSESVRLLGARKQSEIHDELNSADIFVMPSLSEGIPVSCMEAMAMNLPVVATRINGLSELIDDKKTGLLIPPGNKHELANALDWMATHPDERAIMGSHARLTVENKFERKSCTKRLLELWGLS